MIDWLQIKNQDYTEICELLVEDTEPGPAAHVKAIEEVRDPLDAASDELNVLPVHPVSLESEVR